MPAPAELPFSGRACRAGLTTIRRQGVLSFVTPFDAAS